MNLRLVRENFSDEWTLGTLTFNGLPFGFTCEDQDRGLVQTDSLEHIKSVKVKGETCIPYGRYRVSRTWSNKYNRYMMQVLDVRGFQGIRIHSGNNDDDTEGCILVGLTRQETAGTIEKSRAAVNWLDEQVQLAEQRGEEVWLEIVKAA